MSVPMSTVRGWSWRGAIEASDLQLGTRTA